MNFEDFKILCQQSTMVNNTMAQFIEKLSKIRKDPIDPFAFWLHMREILNKLYNFF